MASGISNKIPLRVNHGGAGDNSESYYRSSRTTSGEGGGGGGSVGTGDTAYDMRNMCDETDRIKTRMRDFEERCKRWREDFFTRTNQSGSMHHLDSATTFDQRVPPQATVFNDNSPPSHYHSTEFRPPVGSSPPFASSLHKSHIEDTSDGGKKYKIEFDIGDFKQNELQISTHARTLIVKGDRELKAGAATETKTFNRELSVPEYVDLERMNAYLVENGAGNNILVLEAPIVMDKYTYRRSAFDSNNNTISSSKHQSPTRLTSKSPHFGSTATTTSPSRGAAGTTTSTTVYRTPAGGVTESHHLSENKSTSSTSTHTTSRHVVNNGNYEDSAVVNSSPVYSSKTFSRSVPIGDDYLYQHAAAPQQHSTNRSSSGHRYAQSNQSLAPELIAGYPVYDSSEGCVVYKFDLTGFEQDEIHLTITVDRTLEIKACKELTDHLGKVYREFKREIQLEPDVDANLIKNLLFENVLTLKIPKPNRADGEGSISNSHNLHSPNGFQEIYTDDGKLAKLTSDFRSYQPENVKIVLSANNVLKVHAQQLDASPSRKGTVQKECSRQYTLPPWIQPEHMKAVMSKDGILTVDFTANKSPTASKFDDRIHIN